MSKTFRNFEQVAQHFRCPVHLGKLKDPRRLPCEHTLCKDCLKEVINTNLKKENNQGRFECPECRTKHHIPTSEGGDCSDWFPVDAFCVIQLKTLDRFQDSQVCETHSDKFKEYYCFHHRELYCADCIIAKHTKNPCYARNSRDSVNDVKKHLHDLVGQLRLQEERAIRVAQSKVAESHVDDLLQKVWEVEHLLDRFHKQMKKKIDAARAQIEMATKIPPEDKDHLKTVQSVITQTKKLVEDKLKAVNVKTQDGQNDLLRLWKPLNDQVDQFASVLDAVEKRPFCVNVQIDEAFLDQIALNLEPVVVLNESAQWTPLNPIKVRIQSSDEVGVFRRLQSSKSGPISPRKSVTQLTTTRSNNDSSTTMPQSRATFRTVKTGSETNRSNGRQQGDLPLSTQQKIKERNPTILPKMTSGSLTAGETSKVFTIRGMKLKGISQQSTFEFPCEDIIVLDNTILTITERAVQKFTLRYQFLQSIGLRAPLKLCGLRDDSCYILVLDNNSGISLLTTQPRLQLLYRIATDRVYTEMCHMRTTQTEDAYGRIMYHLHLALTHVWNKEDCIDVMIVSYEREQLTRGLIDQVTLTPSKVKTIAGSNDDACLVNITAICTAPENRKLLVCTESGLVCISRNGDIIWTFQTKSPASSVDCSRGLVYLAVEREKSVLILDPHGNVLVDNIFPTGCKLSQPTRVSVGKSSMIVREFTDNERQGLKSIVHVFTLSY